MINFKKLETFLLVSDLGSLSRAAKFMGATQSFISRQIGQLEDEWGDKLFERTGRGMALSSFGQRLKPEVSLLFEQMRRMDAAVRDNAGILTGDVRIGIIPSMAHRLFPLLFADIQKRAPAVRLHLVEAFTGTLDEQLTAGSLDLAIMNRFDESLRSEEDVLGSLDTLLVGKAGHPLVQRKVVRFNELADVPLVLAPAPNGLRTFLERHSGMLGIRLNIKAEVNTLSAMLNIVGNGDAFTLLGMLAVDELVHAGCLQTSQIVSPAMTRTVSLGLTRHHPLSRPARVVAKRTRELASRLLASQQAA